MSPSEKCLVCDRGSCPGCEPPEPTLAATFDPWTEWIAGKGPKL